MEANSTGGQGSRRAVAPSDDDDRYTRTKGSQTNNKKSVLRHEHYNRGGWVREKKAKSEKSNTSEQHLF